MRKGRERPRAPLIAINALIAISIVIAATAIGSLAISALSLPASISIEGPALNSSGGGMGIYADAKIANRGPLPLSALSLNASASSSRMVLLNITVPAMEIPGGESRAIPLNLSFLAGSLPQSELLRLITSNDTITFRASFGGSLPPLLGASGHVEASVPWLPPISNLRIATTNFTQVDESTISAVLVISFDNLSDFIPVIGKLDATVSDPFGGIYNITLFLDVEPKSSFEGAFPITVTPPTISLADLFFSSVTNITFTINASVEVQGIGVLNFSRASEMGWGGYMGDVEFGIPIILPINMSYSRVTFPFSFTNNNDMPLKANITAILSYANSTLSTSAKTQINAPPHQRSSSQLTMVLPNLFLLLKGTFLSIHIETDFGEFEVGVPINA